MSRGSADPAAGSPRLTLAFLLYNAAAEVPGLVQCLVRQRHPSIEKQSDWLLAVFVDDASSDGTVAAVRASLAGLGHPSHYRLVTHSHNLGLASTLNELFSQAETPFLLTCHLDCRFGSDGYVATMLELIEKHPEAAAITGQPALTPGARLPFAEKVNVVANLMDVIPGRATEELVPVGFAEGRCDVFRVEALRAVGLYDTRLRVSGEDQVLAARLRARGYALYQTPGLAYQLSVSGQQDSLSKLLRHQRLFGRTMPYILFAVPGSVSGIVGSRAGANRTRRALLRATQLAGGAAYAFVVLSLVASWPAWLWAGPLALVASAKLTLQARHARAVRFSAWESLAFVALQPAFDLTFSVGVLEGVWQLARGRTRPIE